VSIVAGKQLIFYLYRITIYAGHIDRGCHRRLGDRDNKATHHVTKPVFTVDDVTRKWGGMPSETGAIQTPFRQEQARYDSTTAMSLASCGALP
jgi:hypothetical protein